MIEIFEIHNLFKKDIQQFLDFDPHLSRLKSLPFVYAPPLKDQIPLETPGIYILTGGRQVGKSTLIKLMIRDLLKKRKPESIFYLPCDTLEYFDQLLTLIQEFPSPSFLFLDEITYVKEWDRAIKALADAGFFQKCSALITGSDSCLLQEAMIRFPGRRGLADQFDFHLFPLSFYETVVLYAPALAGQLRSARDYFQSQISLPPREQLSCREEQMNLLHQFLEKYLVTGGFLTAINQHASSQAIPNSVYATYVQWIVGDLIKRGKKPEQGLDILRLLIDRLCSQLTWQGLASEGLVEHHQTIADYILLLERMDVLNILPAYREDKQGPALKKARKVHFKDPFIFHALHSHIKHQKDPYQFSVQSLREEARYQASLVEGVVGSLASRLQPCYYIKAEREVDLVLPHKKGFLPIEIKWSMVPRPNELKQILKYQKGIVATKGRNLGNVEHLDVVPVPLLAMLL